MMDEWSEYTSEELARRKLYRIEKEFYSKERDLAKLKERLSVAIAALREIAESESCGTDVTMRSSVYIIAKIALEDLGE